MSRIGALFWPRKWPQLGDDFFSTTSATVNFPSAVVRTNLCHRWPTVDPVHIDGSDAYDRELCCIVKYDAVCFGISISVFCRNMLPPCVRQKNRSDLFYPEDGGNVIRRHISAFHWNSWLLFEEDSDIFSLFFFSVFVCAADEHLKNLVRGCGTSKHNCLVSYLLCWRRHVSATVGHLKVTKLYIERKLYVWSYSV